MSNSATIEMEQFTVGRSSGCDLMLTHPSINRAHVKIYFTHDTVLIEDLDSEGGTYVFHEGGYKRIKTAKIRYDTKVRLGSDLEGIQVKEIIDDFRYVQERKKKDLFKRVKSIGLKRCFDCGTVINKEKIYCDCCGAIFEESA